MTQWNITVPDETDQIVRSYLKETSRAESDLSKFVDEAVKQKIFRQTVKELKELNAERDQQELMKLIDEAVDHTRANRT